MAKPALKLVKSVEDQTQESVRPSELEITVMEYVIGLRQAGSAKTTIRHYKWHVERLLLWLTERGVKKSQEVTRAMLREWGAGLYDRWEPATIQQAIAACRSFFRWCVEEGFVRENPAMALKRPKIKQRVQRTVNPDEVGKMLDACDIMTTKGLRDRAIISLLYDSGLRAAEICRLRVDDVDLEKRMLKVVVKGGDERLGWFGETTAKRLQAWLRVRLAPPGVYTIFVAVGGSTPGYPLSIHGLYRMVREVAKKAGVPKMSVHAFRRGFAVHLTKNNVPNSVLQDLGRWKDPAMIKRYTLALQAGEIYQGKSPIDDVAETKNAVS